MIANALGVNISMNCVQHEINNGPFPDGAPATPFIMFSYECVARLQATGVSVTGVGSCNSWEDKYLYRNEWKNGSKQRVEVGYGIYSAMNTLQKMAKKRAYIDAVKLAASCSDIFHAGFGRPAARRCAGSRASAQGAATRRCGRVNRPRGAALCGSAAVEQPVTETLSAKAQRVFPGMDWKVFGVQVMVQAATPRAVSAPCVC